METNENTLGWGVVKCETNFSTIYRHQIVCSMHSAPTPIEHHLTQSKYYSSCFSAREIDVCKSSVHWSRKFCCLLHPFSLIDPMD